MRIFTNWAIISLLSFNYIIAQQGGTLRFNDTNVERFFNSSNNSENIYLTDYQGKPLKALQFILRIENSDGKLDNLSLTNGADVPSSRFLFDYEIHNKIDFDGKPFIDINVLILGNDHNDLISGNKYHLCSFNYNIMESSDSNSYVLLSLINIAGATSTPVEDAKINSDKSLNILISHSNIGKSKITLNQNYPNPFNPSTFIQYTLTTNQFVTLKVYNLLGVEIETLVNEEKPSGSYNVEFPSVESHKNTMLPSGIYFYTVRAGEFAETKKMILVK